MPMYEPAVLVDLVIAFALLEGIALLAWHATTGRGLSPGALAANLMAGLALLMALRSVLAGGPAAACAGWLVVAGLAHGIDLWRRWPRTREQAPAARAARRADDAGPAGIAHRVP